MKSLAYSSVGKATGKACLAHSDKHCSLPISAPRGLHFLLLSSVFSCAPNRALKLIISSRCNLKSGLEGKRRTTDSLERLSINLMTSVDGKNGEDRSTKRVWMFCTMATVYKLQTSTGQDWLSGKCRRDCVQNGHTFPINN